MAKEYHQGKYSLQTLKGKLDKKQLTAIGKMKFLPDLYLETSDGKVTGTIFLYKSTNSWEDIVEYSGGFVKAGFTIKNQKVGSQIDIKAGSKTIRLYKSGGRLQNIIDEEGNALSKKKPSTAQQEDGVVYSLNHGEFDADYLREEIGFPFDKSWNESFRMTFDIIKANIKIGSYESYRDSNNKKPKFLNEITDESILPDKKDNWNPADVWMVKNGFKGGDLSTIAKAIKKGDAAIADLNAEILKEFDNGNLIGISLKKVEKKANFKKITVDKSITESTKYKKYGNKTKMSVLNSYMDVNLVMEQSGKTFDYLIRLRPRGKSGSLKVYFEGKPPSRGTWDGAVSKKLLENKYFGQKLNNFEELVMSRDKFEGTFKQYIEFLGDKDIIKFLSKSNKLVTFTDMDKKETNTYFLQRGAVLAYCVYLMSSAKSETFYPDSVLSAMKLNDFSSVYYKVYG